MFKQGRVAYTKFLVWRYIGDIERRMNNIAERWEGSEIRLKIRRSAEDRQCLECDAIIYQDELHGWGRKSVQGEKVPLHYCVNCIISPTQRIGPLRTMLPPAAQEHSDVPHT